MIDDAVGAIVGNGSTFGTDSGVGSTITLLETQLPAIREQRSRAEAELAAVTAEEEAITKALEGLRLLSGTSLDGPSVPSSEMTAAPSQAVQDRGPAAAEPVGKQAAPSPAEPAATATAAKKRTAAKPPAKKAATAKKTASAGARGTRVLASGAKKVAGKSAASAEPAAAAKRVPTARKAAAKRGPAGGEAAAASAPQTGRRRKVADAENVLELLSQAGGPLRAREVIELLGLDAVEGNVNAIRTMLERLAKDNRAQRTGRGLYTVATARPGAGS